MIITFGSSYREILSRLPQEEFTLLQKAYGLYQFGPRQQHYLNGNLISSIASVAGGEMKLHQVYPGVFYDPNEIRTLEQASNKADNLFKFKEQE